MKLILENEQGTDHAAHRIDLWWVQRSEEKRNFLGGHFQGHLLWNQHPAHLWTDEHRHAKWWQVRQGEVQQADVGNGQLLQGKHLREDHLSFKGLLVQESQHSRPGFFLRRKKSLYSAELFKGLEGQEEGTKVLQRKNSHHGVPNVHLHPHPLPPIIEGHQCQGPFLPELLLLGLHQQKQKNDPDPGSRVDFHWWLQEAQLPGATSRGANPEHCARGLRVDWE